MKLTGLAKIILVKIAFIVIAGSVTFFSGCSSCRLDSATIVDGSAHLYQNRTTGKYRFVVTVKFSSGGDLDMSTLDLSLSGTSPSAVINAKCDSHSTETYTIFEDKNIPDAEWMYFTFTIRNSYGAGDNVTISIKDVEIET